MNPPVSNALGLAPIVPDWKPSLDVRFAEWIQANPAVYWEFVALARQTKAAGFSHYSAKTIAEVMRWHRSLATRGDSFKLNNSFVSRLARMAEHYCPDLHGFFEFRSLHS